jgi:hypothetical protein
MNVDISGGFIVKNTTKLDSAYNAIPTWMLGIHKKVRELSQDAIVGVATELYDRASVGKPDYLDVATSPYEAAIKIMEYDLEEATKQNKPSEYDLGINISIGVARQKRVIGVIHANSPVITQHFMSFENIKEYNCSVVTGKPKSISEKNWSQRLDDWESLIINPDHLHLVHFSLFENNVLVLPSLDDNVTLPSYPVRLQKLAMKHTMDQCKLEFGLNTLQKAYEFVLNNPVYTKRLDETTARYDRLLDKDLTVKKLQKE